MPTKSKAKPVAEQTPAVSLCSSADSLFRAAAECCRQHARYSRLVEHDVCDAEEDAACELVTLSDTLLHRMVNDYVAGAASANGHGDDAWWHKANMLLQASREYVRHARRCDDEGRRMGTHTAARLGELALEYELAASAIMALRHAVDDYRRVRPEADLTAHK
ncbi:MAG: hypothetical protein ABJD07_08785 [Gemmatimonadaceae bacterium]